MTQSRILLAVVAAVAASAAFYFLVLSPKRDEVVALDAQIATKKAELATNQQLVADYQTAKTGYRTAYASVVRLGKAVPVDEDVRSLVVQIDGAAKRTDVNFRSINVGGSAGTPAAAPAPAGGPAVPPGATVGAAGFPVMPFTFSFDGSFYKLSDFFQRLESFVSVRNQNVSVTGRLLTIDTLTLNPTEYPKLTAEVGATSFLVSPMQGLTNGATPQGPAVGTPATPPAATASAASAVPTTATSTGAVG